PRYSDIDTGAMAAAAVDIAVRHAVATGVDYNHLAILDNFCWPKVDRPESRGALVRTCRGAYDTAMAYGLPFISGKDSLNNEFVMSSQEAARTGLPERIAIPYTLLVSAIGIVDDVTRCVTMDTKSDGNVLAIASAPCDQVGLVPAYANHVRVSKLIRNGKVAAAHDVNDGGLAVAVAEMSIASQRGASVMVSHEAYSASLFEPLAGTYVLEMSREDAEAEGLTIVGTVTTTDRLTIDINETRAVDLSLTELDRAWRTGLRMN
ncbi:MAG: AIR synthase-related protein, partial [Phycisphaerae bacterium]